MRIGFIGVGVMGGPMARNLHDDGHDVAVSDVSEEALARAAAWGARRCESPAAAASDAAVVFLSLPGPDEVRAVVEGDGGVLDAVESSAIVVDTTTTLPGATEEIAAAFEARGVDFLGAPVSGGPVGAREGTLSIMVGGPESAFARCEPLFETVAERPFYVGDDPAHGHAIKLLNNAVSFAGFVATCEAAVVGRRFGVDLETMIDVMNASSGRNSATDHKFPDYVLPGSFDMGSPIRTMEKDVKLATEFGENQDVPMAVGQHVSALIQYASAYCGERADYTEVYRFFEAMMDE